MKTVTVVFERKGESRKIGHRDHSLIFRHRFEGFTTIELKNRCDIMLAALAKRNPAFNHYYNENSSH